MKSEKNKTIDLTKEEGEAYLARCLRAPADLQRLAQGPEGAGLPMKALQDQVIWGDSFDVLPVLARGCTDLLIADPPYNLNKDFSGETFHEMPKEAYAEFTRRWLKLCLPLLKKTASVYVCCDWKSSMIIGPVLAERLTVRSRITWQREKGRGAKSNWKNGLEDIWFATVSSGEDYTFHIDDVRQRRRVIAPYRENGKPKDWEESEDGRFRDTCPSNFWDDISIPYWSMAENTAHPAQKPEKLMAKLILASSSPEDLVLDPFLGSGTTAVTAAKLGRHFLGIERSGQYCALTQKRLEMAAEDPTIQGYADGVFWERNTAQLQRQARRGKKR